MRANFHDGLRIQGFHVVHELGQFVSQLNRREEAIAIVERGCDHFFWAIQLRGCLAI
jgi:hypothetical protein